MKYNISLRTTLASLIAFGLLATSHSQTATKNYITTYLPKVPRSDEMSIPLLLKDSCIKTVQYFDGLGRPDQTIQVASSPTGKDIVQPIEYDQYGREAKKHLPYRGSNSNGNYVTNDLTEQRNYYLSLFSDSPDKDYPFAITVFENSPLNRVMMQGAPGYAWQPSQHPVRYAYSTNTTNDVRLWTVNTNNSITTSGFYQPGKLYKTIIKDENWTDSSGNLNTTEEYKGEYRLDCVNAN